MSLRQVSLLGVGTLLILALVLPAQGHAQRRKRPDPPTLLFVPSSDLPEVAVESARKAFQSRAKLLSTPKYKRAARRKGLRETSVLALKRVAVRGNPDLIVVASFSSKRRRLVRISFRDGSSAGIRRNIDVSLSRRGEFTPAGRRKIAATYRVEINRLLRQERAEAAKAARAKANEDAARAKARTARAKDADDKAAKAMTPAQKRQAARRARLEAKRERARKRRELLAERRRQRAEEARERAESQAPSGAAANEASASDDGSGGRGGSSRDVEDAWRKAGDDDASSGDQGDDTDYLAEWEEAGDDDSAFDDQQDDEDASAAWDEDGDDEDGTAPDEERSPVYLAVHAGFGGGHRQIKLPGTGGDASLNTNPYAVGYVEIQGGLLIRDRSILLGIEGDYESSIGLSLRQSFSDGLTRTVDAKSHRTRVGFLSQFRLGQKGDDAPEILLGAGVAFRFLHTEQALGIPRHTIGGPYLRTGVLFSVGHSALRIGILPHAAALLRISDGLREAGVDKLGFMVGGEFQANYSLNQWFQLGLLYRESHALISTEDAGRYRDAMRTVLLRATYLM